MHVPCAHLKAVHIFFDHGQITRIHDFRDYGQSCLRARLGEEPKPFFAQPLKTVWRSARFECAATQDFRAGFFHNPRDGENLLSAFHRAWTANQNDLFVFAHWYATDGYGGRATGIARGKFVGFQHGHDGFYARHGGKRFFAKQRFGPNHTDDDSRGAATDVRVQPEIAHTGDDPIDLLLSRVGLRDDDHISTGGIIRMPPPRIFCKPRC